MVSCGSIKDHKGCLEGHVERSGQGVGRAGQRLRTCLYQGLWVECFGILRFRQDRSVQTPKRGVLVSSPRVLLKWRGWGGRGRPGQGPGTLLMAKAIGESRWELNLLVVLWLLSRVGLGRGGWCWFQVAADHLAKQNGRHTME